MKIKKIKYQPQPVYLYLSNPFPIHKIFSCISLNQQLTHLPIMLLLYLWLTDNVAQELIGTDSWWLEPIKWHAVGPKEKALTAKDGDDTATSPHEGHIMRVVGRFIDMQSWIGRLNRFVHMWRQSSELFAVLSRFLLLVRPIYSMPNC